MQYTTKHGSLFAKNLKEFSGGRLYVFEAFNIFLEMAFFALTQSVYRLTHNGALSKEIEEKYAVSAKKCHKPEIAAQLLGCVVEGLEEGAHDFLGEVYMIEELSKSRAGQFFTPYHLSRTMAQLTSRGLKPTIGKRTTINDPACGSGSMLIASVEEMKAVGFKQNEIFCLGEDVDSMCCKMAYIQLSLLDIPARISHRNTLTQETWGQWDTIGYVREPFPLLRMVVRDADSETAS